MIKQIILQGYIMGILSNSIHICLFVEDIEKMVGFYRDVLGFEADWDGGPLASFKINDGGLFMYDRKLFSKAMNQPYAPARGYNTTMEIGIAVPKHEYADNEYKRLILLGVKSLTGKPVTQPWGQKNFFFADSEGNYIEIGSQL